MDFSDLKENNNIEKIAIICVGYNRLNGLKRLIDSLLKAHYVTEDVPLIISIDCSNDESVYNYAKEVAWPFGKKYVNIQNKRLGLKNHIFQCGDLSQYFKAIIILEDDLYVSPAFYDFTIEVVNAYKNSNVIAGFSLYAPELNGFVNLPFIPLHNGADVYLAQDVPTWGECFTFSHWKKFKEWYSTIKEEDILNTEMPYQIKTWTRAWSKYFYTYVVNNNKYFIYPYNSYTTNFSEVGEHSVKTNNVQVSLLCDKKRPLFFVPDDNLVRYDVYLNNEALYNILNFTKNQLAINLYSNEDISSKKRYLLTTKILNYKVINSYGLRLRPIELNIIQNIEGSDIYLYDTTVEEKNYGNNQFQLTDYYLHGFNRKKLFNYIKQIIIQKVKDKIKIWE